MLPAWAQWRGGALGASQTVGIEEEVMLLEPEGWSLAHRIDDILPVLGAELADHLTAETHGAAIELATGVHTLVSGAIAELADLRGRLVRCLATYDLRAAGAGTHPFAVWQDTVISGGERYQFVYGSMRELARREPTFALHVHVGVPDPELAIDSSTACAPTFPLLLALSANSPFWQGRDTGLASARTPLFQAFPRVGIPRRFDSYAHYVEAVDLLIRCEAFPEPTFLWWDVRPQPRFGTVEVRIMDAQTEVWETAALVALVCSLARLELEEGYASPALVGAPEVLDENRFLAARDGIDAGLVDPDRERRIPVRALLPDLVVACEPHARALGCAAELDLVAPLAERGGARRQLDLAREPERLEGLVRRLADAFAVPSGAGDTLLSANSPEMLL